MDVEQATKEFLAQYKGKYIDEDGYYGSQCWDLVARYAREKVGAPSFPTGSGGAEGLFRLFSDPIPRYFDRIAYNGSNTPQIGDIVVYSSKFFPPYGHTALVLSATPQTITVLEQNGAMDYNGDGIADGVAYVTNRGYTNLAGWLRPKNAIIGGDMSTVGEVEFNDLYRAFFGKDVMERQPPTEGDRKRWIGKETNTVIREMEADPRHPNYLQYVTDLEKAVQTPAPAPSQPNSALTPDQAQTLNRIDQAVQWIKDKIGAIFK